MSTPTTPPTGETPDTPVDVRKESLIEYPSKFPIKVMGAKVDGFVPYPDGIIRLQGLRVN